MDVGDAVERAKMFAANMLKDEGLQNLGLEEVEFNESDDTWDVTLGFSRPWNSSRGALSAIAGETLQRRAYRVFRVRNSDGQVLSMKQRDLIE